MSIRETDSRDIRIDRTIPLWGIMMLAAALFGNAVVLWSGQREQAIKFDNLSVSVNGVLSKQETQSIAAQANAAQVTKIDTSVTDLQRRVLRIEARTDK